MILRFPLIHQLENPHLLTDQDVCCLLKRLTGEGLEQQPQPTTPSIFAGCLGDLNALAHPEYSFQGTIPSNTDADTNSDQNPAVQEGVNE